MLAYRSVGIMRPCGKHEKSPHFAGIFYGKKSPYSNIWPVQKPKKLHITMQTGGVDGLKKALEALKS